MILIAADVSAPLATGGILFSMAAIFTAMTPTLHKVVTAWFEDRKAERDSRERLALADREAASRVLNDQLKIQDLEHDRDVLLARLTELEARCAAAAGPENPS